MFSIIFCLIICAGILFTGCFGHPQTSEVEKEYKVGNIVLKKIEIGEFFDLFVEEKTKIVYIYSKESYQGGMSVLYNKEGNPMTYNEYINLVKGE